MLSQCVARRPRHRAFSSQTLQLNILIFHVFQASLSRSAANNSFKTIICAVDFLDFVASNPTNTSPKAIQNRLKIGSGAVPRALGGDLGTILVLGRPKAQKWSQQTANPWSLFAQKSRLGHFSWSCSLLFVRVLFLPISVGFGCPKP